MKSKQLNPFVSVLTIALTLVLGSVLLWWLLTPSPMYCIYDGKVMTVESRAVIEGMEAGVSGKPVDDCPYSSPQREHPHWVRGWLEGRAAIKTAGKP